MERSTWTDARLDDRFDQIDKRFDRVDRELVDLRTETRTGFSELRGEMADLRSTVFRTNVSLWIAMVGLIAAVLARGA